MIKTVHVIPTATGVVVPWEHRELIALIEENEPPCRCSSCRSLVGLTTLGYGVDATVCFDCNKIASEQMQQRLREYRAA